MEKKMRITSKLPSARQQWLGAALVLLASGMISGCSMNKKPQEAKYESRILESGTIALKNNFLMTQSMATATGVDPTGNVTVQDPMATIDFPALSTFVAPWLSNEGKVSDLNPSMLQAITAAASSYCLKFVSTDLALNQGKVMSTVNSGAGTAGLTDTVLSKTMGELYLKFLKREPNAEEKTILLESGQQFRDEAQLKYGNNATGLREALVPYCTLVLASPDFLRI